MSLSKEQREALKAIAEFEPTGDNFSDRVNQQVTNEADLKAVARQAILDLLADLEAEELMSHTLRHHLMSRDAELAATRKQLVYEFNGDEVPVFRSGVDTPHELESVVDAERCQGLIGLIRQLRQQLAEAQASSRKQFKAIRSAIRGTVTEKVETERETVYLGAPAEDDPAHNCDAMGCGSAHVLARVQKPATCDKCNSPDLCKEYGRACEHGAAQRPEGGEL